MGNEHLTKTLKHQYEEWFIKEKYVEKRLKELPEGRLKITHNKGKPFYYLQKDGKIEYIHKDNDEYIKYLAERSYLEKLQKALKLQTKSISAFLNSYSQSMLIQAYDSMHQDRKNLITPLFLSDEEYAKQWQSVEYISKTISEDIPEIITEKGERVRSKSEKIIADKLYYRGIPYKYERPLKLKSYGIVYPDFTVLNIKTREELYWEHFGMMDNEEYFEKCFLKLDSYEKDGLFVGKKLIITRETLKHPINTFVVDQYISEYLV